jgi:hypothetical protein
MFSRREKQLINSEDSAIQKLTYTQLSDRPDISLLNTIKTRSIHISHRVKRPDLMDILLVMLPLLSIFLWSISLQPVSLSNMNDLGLISVFSYKIIIAMGILVVSFALALQQRELRTPLLALHLICIILILYGTTNFIEETLHFSVIYRHAGYTEYIMRKGTVDPYLDTYFNWPGFFVLSAIVTKLSGYSTILTYAGWAPVFYNLIYFGPMYIIFTSMTTNKRLVWLSIFFFYITNWVGQDYFSPQGLNFFLYLVIIAILLKWFRMPAKVQAQQIPWQTDEPSLSFKQKFLTWFKTPDPYCQPLQPWQKRAVLCCLILVFWLVVCSHPLTPFFTLLSVTALILFRRCYPFWLPILFAAMTTLWLFIVARPFLTLHTSMIVDTLGDLTGNVPKSITSGSMEGSPLYQIIAKFRLYTTLLVWLLALIGCIKRLHQGYRDITYVLLTIAGFPLIVAQSYGGEMLMRIYLFTQPFMLFFAASLFCGKPMLMKQAVSPWKTVVIIFVNLMLLSSFFFTRYGDERVDFITADEWNGMQYIYNVAPAHSLLLLAWNDTPVQFQDYEKYDVQSLAYIAPTIVTNTQPDGVIKYVKDEHDPTSYIVFERGQLNQLTAWSGAPEDILQQLERRLLLSRKFKLIYSNSDIQILKFIG